MVAAALRAGMTTVTDAMSRNGYHDVVADVRSAARSLEERFSAVRLPVPSISALAWLLPPVVFLAVRILPDSLIQALIGLGLGVGALVLVWRFPSQALVVLIAALPLQYITLAVLYRLGMPAPVVRGMAAYRDIIVIGLLVLALRRGRGDRTPLDTLDKLALVYVVIATAYLILPDLFVPAASPFGPGAPHDLQVRLLSYRANISFVVLFVAARHIPVSADITRRVTKVVLVIGLVVAAGTLFEFLFSSAWNTFAVQTIRVTRYDRDILNAATRPIGDVRAYMNIGGKLVDRPGSIFFDPIQTGFYLLLPLGIAVSMAARRTLSRAYLALPLLASAVLLTYVRSAVLAGVVIAIFALRSQSGARVRLALVLGTGAVFLVFAALGSGFTSRLGGDNGAAANSNTLHARALSRGYAALDHRPLGAGLGSEPGIADRFVTGSEVVTEDAYLQVGTTLGIPAMLLFATILFTIIRRLRRAQSALPGDALAAAYRPIGMGLAVGGFFLHIWNGLPMAMTFWGGAGLLLGLAERSVGADPSSALVEGGAG